MHLVAQIAFIVLTIVAILLFARKAKEIRANILLGRDEDFSDQPAERWKNVLLLALGQKKMFRKPIVAILHLAVYAGFIIINIEVLEIALDGLLGSHRLFARPLGSFYPAFINMFELLAVLVLTACAIFLIRRNIVKVPRLQWKELNGWPKEDANIILITEIILMLLFLTMNAADTTLQQRDFAEYGQHITGNFFFSSFLHPLFTNTSSETLMTIERTCWWLHIIGIFAFLNYLPYSKHLHILLAFPNAYYARIKPQGKMRNMPEIQQEVLYAMQPETAPVGDTAEPEHKKFGAKDIFDLSWRNLQDAYTCTECGRCAAACPATITGKKLNPRKIMMDTRDRMEDVRANIKKNGTFTDDGKTLLRDYITEEELRACTTCQACVQECPVAISPLDIIVQMRRYLIMEESSAPAEWNSMFSNTENNFAPWKLSPDERDKWAEG
ncbi:(Fe-S)-binding protein [Ilyomonas limi]|uniref:(Fe-S)-binding protein n=1 Tax=Ilyomonas limi TaxID=2575867 RepID=A0A4U3KZF3_9BACT|nr:(Fe-S)-binding protein [Ilyomonas limi]TKK67204.1 (Fe-S)-binding protein [Ilyomonas limi]